MIDVQQFLAGGRVDREPVRAYPERWDALHEKIEQGQAAYTASLYRVTPGQLIENAEEIAANRFCYNEIHDTDLSRGELEQLLSLDDPLEYLRGIWNEVHHSRHVDVEVRTTEIVRDAERLIGQCQNACGGTEAYQLLRCIGEQTISENGTRRLRDKGTESPRATSLQNPTDPEATYSGKAGKQHIGYAANIVEAVGSGGSVAVDYQYEQNTHSDSRFLTDHLKQLPAQNEEAFIVVDGAYSGQNLRDAALKKNVQLISTSLKGISVPNIYADFEISDDGKVVLRCPAGHNPLRCGYVSAAKQARVYFPHDLWCGVSTFRAVPSS